MALQNETGHDAYTSRQSTLRSVKTDMKIQENSGTIVADSHFHTDPLYLFYMVLFFPFFIEGEMVTMLLDVYHVRSEIQLILLAPKCHERLLEWKCRITR